MNKFYSIKLFTNKSLKLHTSYSQGGNPAAVCLLEEDISDELKQKIAMEMNISETAFVLPMEKTDQNPFKNGAKFELRWFTPTTEVPLCGHATLASAATLFYTQFNENVSKNFSYLLMCQINVHARLFPAKFVS